jgi:hypothetical protein
MLIMYDLEIFKRLSAVRSPYTHSKWYDDMLFKANHDRIFSRGNEKRHNDLRAKMAAVVSQRILIYYD